MWLAVAEATRGSSFEPQSPAVVSKTWLQKMISTLQMFIDNYFDLTRFQYPNTGLVMLNMTTMMVTMMMMILPSFLPSFKRHFYNSDEWRKCRAVEDSDFRDINFSEVEHS